MDVAERPSKKVRFAEDDISLDKKAVRDLMELLRKQNASAIKQDYPDQEEGEGIIKRVGSFLKTTPLSSIFSKMTHESREEKIMKVLGPIALDEYTDDRKEIVVEGAGKDGTGKTYLVRVLRFYVRYPNRVTVAMINDLSTPSKIDGIADIQLTQGRDRIGEICVEIHTSDDKDCVNYYLGQEVQKQLVMQKLPPAGNDANMLTRILNSAIRSCMVIEKDKEIAPVTQRYNESQRLLQCSSVCVKAPVTRAQITGLNAFGLFYGLSFGAYETRSKLVMFFEVYTLSDDDSTILSGVQGDS